MRFILLFFIIFSLRLYSDELPDISKQKDNTIVTEKKESDNDDFRKFSVGFQIGSESIGAGMFFTVRPIHFFSINFGGGYPLAPFISGSLLIGTNKHSFETTFGKVSDMYNKDFFIWSYLGAGYRYTSNKAKGMFLRIGVEVFFVNEEDLPAIPWAGFTFGIVLHW